MTKCNKLQITAGLRHSMALTDDRQLWVWGDNSEGQLGAALPHPCLLPTPIHAFPAEATVMYVVAGGEHSLAAVQNMTNGGAEQARHMWPECRGDGLTAMPSPSLAAALAQPDPDKKVRNPSQAWFQFCVLTQTCSAWGHACLPDADTQAHV